MTNSRRWQARGLCHLEENSYLRELFFAGTAVERRPAKRLCIECPVRAICLQTALERKDIWGVSGGCDPAEIRRALSVDPNGHATKRCRYPHCPYCHASPNQLHVVGICEIATGRTRERVECLGCGFSWKASSSVRAVKEYWRERRRLQRATVRATVPTGRIASGGLDPVVVPLRPAGPRVTSPTSMVASARPNPG